MSLGLYLFAILFCFIAVAFFEGTETGVLSINHARLMHLVRAGSKPAKILSGYVADMQHFLATTLVGTNLMSVVLSTLSADLGQRWFPGFPFVQTAWATGMAFMILFFSQYLPKLFFTTRPLRRTLLVARVFYVFERLFSPLAAALLFSTRWLAPKNRSISDQRFLMTREYIQNVVSDPKDGSRITAVERLMINRVLALQSQTAAQVMTPLALASKTTESAPLGACYRLVRDTGHLRLPVFSDDGARCVGMLNALAALGNEADPEKALVRDCMQPPFFVNADVRADDVLPLMRKYRQPIALVRAPSSGAVIGIITEENILLALTGNLQSA